MEIATHIGFVVANLIAIFFVKSRFSSQIIISLLVLFLIGLISFIFDDGDFFLKISFALAFFLVVANYFLSCDLDEKKANSYAAKKIKTLFSVLFCLLLLFLVSYLGKAVISNNVVPQIHKSTLIHKDKANLMSLRTRKVEMVKNIIKGNVLVDNLLLIILISTCLPLFLINLSRDEHI